MSIKFIIDSASDILPAEAEALGAVHLPLRVLFGEEEYTDGVSLNHREFYERLTAKGMGAEDICKVLNEEKRKIHLFAVVDTLEYLRKGGRISTAAALAGNLLSVKPLIEVKHGEVSMLGKARGRHKAGALLYDTIMNCSGIDDTKPYAMTYSGLEDELMQRFIEDYPELWKGDRGLITASVGCAIGTHVGPGAYGVAFFEK